MRSPEPNACRHCGIRARSHGRRWTAAIGWHFWTAPDDALIKTRMLARRAQQQES